MTALSGVVLYLVVAAAVAIATFLLSEWVRLPGASAPDHLGLMAVAAGLLWPVLAVGLAQFALVSAVHRRILGKAATLSKARVAARPSVIVR